MLSKNNIETYLQQINDELAKKGTYGEVIVCGGAVMAMVYNARDFTKDIDAAYAPKEEIQKIISQIAANQEMEEDWLNDGVKGFLDTQRLNFEEIRSYSHLTVKAPDTEGMLALKLASARTESKDADDAIVLMKELNIECMEEIYDILEKYIHPNRLTAQVSFFSQEVFQNYKLEKQEREASPMSLRSRCHDVIERSQSLKQDHNDIGGKEPTR